MAFTTDIAESKFRYTHPAATPGNDFGQLLQIPAAIAFAPTAKLRQQINSNLQSQSALLDSIESAGITARVINTPTAFVRGAIFCSVRRSRGRRSPPRPPLACRFLCIRRPIPNCTSGFPGSAGSAFGLPGAQSCENRQFSTVLCSGRPRSLKGRKNTKLRWRLVTSESSPQFNLVRVRSGARLCDSKPTTNFRTDDTHGSLLLRAYARIADRPRIPPTPPLRCGGRRGVPAHIRLDVALGRTKCRVPREDLNVAERTAGRYSPCCVGYEGSSPAVSRAPIQAERPIPLAEHENDGVCARSCGPLGRDHVGRRTGSP